MGGRRRTMRSSCCLLLLLVLALAGVEYLIGSIQNTTDEYASHSRTYFYEPIFNANQPNVRNGDKSITWPKLSTKENPTDKDLDPKNTTVFINKFNITHNETENTEVITEKQDLTGNTTVQPGEKESPAYIGTPMFIKEIMKGLHNLDTTEEAIKKTDPPPPLCAKMPPDLGPIPVNMTDLELDIVDKKFPEIQWGGRYTPPNCTARHRVAIIVPYRDRQKHLAIFLNHMHPFLMKQQIEYGIFIIEQEGSKDFNRARVKNVGFVESQRLDSGWQCFVFHDIDLLPLDTRNLYSCPRQPRHMSASIDIYDFKIRFDDIFGGVIAMTKEQFTKVNGFSNKYWGWGGEDDDLFYRLKNVNYHVARYKMSIARYATLGHKKCMPNPKRYELLAQTSKTFQIDGLSTLEYELVKVAQHHLYTHVLANVDVRTKYSLSKYIHHVFRQALTASATLLSITILYIMYLSTIDKYLFTHTETKF